MSYDNRIDEHIKLIQKSIDTDADGAWGAKSQKALIESGKKLTYNWSKLRKFTHGLKQSQVDGFNTILDAVNEYGNDSINPLYFAYMLATVWHETAHTMQPIREIGRGRNRKYGRKIDIDGTRYRGLPHIYYGRGYVQLTWLSNYVKMRDELGVDFVNKPELVLVAENSANIMIVGMLKGIFTGLSLEDCIRYGSYGEFVFARRIINGTDRDELIAGYAVRLLEAIVVE